MKFKFIVCTTCLQLAIGFSGLAKASQKIDYPASRTVDVTDNYFGTSVADPYRWLEDATTAEVKTWVSEQDTLARNLVHAIPGRDALLKRYKELYYQDSIYTPVRRGSRFFYLKKSADQERSVLYWKDKDQEHVLIDPNQLSQTESVTLGEWFPSKDGNWMAYALHPNNSDHAIYHVISVESLRGSDNDVIDNAVEGGVIWRKDNSGFYYVYTPTDSSIPPSDRSAYSVVRFHQLGSDVKTDTEIFPKTGNPQIGLSVDLQEDRWLFVYVVDGWVSNKVYVKDLNDSSSNFKPVFDSTVSTATVSTFQGSFYVSTNDLAPNTQIFKAQPQSLDRKSWQLLIPERKDSVISSWGIFGGKLVLLTLKNASSHLEIWSLDGKMESEVQLPSIGTVSAFTGDPNEDHFYIMFESFTVPEQIYEVAASTGKMNLWAASKAPIDPTQFQVEQQWYHSKDGTTVSMFVVTKKDAVKNGNMPFLLYGYGGFDVNEVPVFSALIYPWLEAGGGFALANLRGDGEYGEDWHRAGMLDKKQNVFDDFIAAGEFLIQEGYTRPEKLTIRGGSNGGLLVGALITQRPDLFRAAICGVPLLDMLRYQLFGEGKTWIPEYGSSDDQSQFKTLFAYSPYQHVIPGVAYPAVLFDSADSDDRVDPLHARKMTAAMQAASSSGRPILLRIEKNSGHTGAAQAGEAAEKAADIISFLLEQVSE